MRVELPTFRRCCFCIPLRYGLLVWGYLKFVICCLLMFVSYLQVNYMMQYPEYIDGLAITRFVFTFIIRSMNFVFTILLIVSAHKKCPKLLRAFYCCDFFAVGANVLLTICVLINGLIDLHMNNRFRYWQYLVMDALVGLLHVCFQVYILAMVRSEVLKLENSNEFRFVNIAADAERRYNQDYSNELGTNDTIEKKEEEESEAHEIVAST